MSSKLLADVKNYLDITWADENTDAKVSGIIQRGMIFLNAKAGGELDYSAEERPKELLMEYCKYARNGILHEFKINYAPFLTDLRTKGGGAYGEATNI